MIYATDVFYPEPPPPAAVAAAVGFADWDAASPHEEHTLALPWVAPYEPGQFHRRELPCLLAVLADLRPSIVIVDGHVWLAPGRPGLGRHLWDALDRAVPVIGVAKSAFAGGAPHAVHRGGSARPLFVTAAGMDPADAAERVGRMHGPHRIPTLVKRADALSRGFP